MEKHPIDLSKWEYKEHFEFFNSLDNPFVGVTVQIDVTNLYREAKTNHASFFLYSLHKILKAVNETETFRYRIDNGIPVCYDLIHASATIAKEDGLFSFCFLEYDTNRGMFMRNAEKAIENVRVQKGLGNTKDNSRNDLIHFSAIPWFSFTEMNHPGSFVKGNSIPKISTGKVYNREGKMIMPVSITAHHGFIDGKQIGLLLAKIDESMINSPSNNNDSFIF